MGLIRMEEKGDFPAPVNNAEEYCLECGHCAAICPHDAFIYRGMNPGEWPLVEKDLLPDAEQLRQLLLARRSIRNYKKQAVPRETMAELIDTARFAPTGSNKQQVHWMVYEDRAKVEDLADMVADWTRIIIPHIPDEEMKVRMQSLLQAFDQGEDRILHRAPHLIIVHSQADLPFAHTDCIIALTYLELYAFSKGLGTCWAGYFTTAANIHPPLIKALNLPEGHQCFGAVTLGYPQHDYTRIPPRKEPLLTWR